MNGFLQKHIDILTELDEKFPDDTVYVSENQMNLGTFPSIGLFLAMPVPTLESRKFVEIQYEYMLVVANIYDTDDPDSQISVQRSTYEKLTTIINTMNYTISSPPEPMIRLAVGEGAFVTGWSVFIKFNA